MTSAADRNGTPDGETLRDRLVRAANTAYGTDAAHALIVDALMPTITETLAEERATCYAGAADQPAAEDTMPTPAEWLRHLFDRDADGRLAVAAWVIESGHLARDCFQANHAARLWLLDGVEWRTEHRLSRLPNQPLATGDPARDLADMRAAHKRLGGRIESRRVGETPWTPVEPVEAAQDTQESRQ